MVCENCQEPYTPTEEERRRLGVLNGGPITLYRGRGCEACRGTGYRGRIGVFELMPMTERLVRLILEGESTDRVRVAARAGGMRTLQQHGIARVLRGHDHDPGNGAGRGPGEAMSAMARRVV